LSETSGGGRRPGIVMAFPYLTTIEELLWPRAFTRDMWMIVDAARDPQIYPMLVASYLEYSCLYSGRLAPAVERAAPYLVQLEFEGSYTRRLLERAWGNSWGIILKCDSSLPKLRRHLRQFLTVRDPRGQQLLFRYYDPRVLRIYLPTCTREELRTVFGPVECFYVEDRNPADLVEFRREEGRLVTAKMSLVEPRVV
jgi:hypothetical protein